MNPFWTNFVIDVLLFIYVVDCLFLGLVIMMQRSKQEGLGAAFGGGMMDSTFGAQTSQVLVKTTVWATIIFFVLSITLARLYSHRASFTEAGSSVQQLLSMPVKSEAPAIPSALSTNAVTPVAPAPTAPVTQPAANNIVQPVAPTPSPTTPAKPGTAPTPGK